MKSKIIILSGLLVLGACAPTMKVPSTGQGYEYIGCHQVGKNPLEDGSVAMGPFGLDPVVTLNTVWFTQLSSDGTLSKIKRIPCKSILDERK